MDPNSHTTNTSETGLLEALLFTSGDAMTYEKISRLLDIPKDGVLRQASALDEQLRLREGSGITLVRTDTTVALATAEHVSSAIEKLHEKTLEKDIGPAGLEILAIVLYKGPSTRASIDYVRGVNSSSTLRNLAMRHLLERVKNPDDAREFVYRPTVELLAHLGVQNTENLPEYATIRGALEEFLKQHSNHAGDTDDTTRDE